MSDVKQVCTVYDKIEINICSLQALGIKCLFLLIAVMTEKIPDEFCLIIGRMMKSSAWNINELMEAFNELEAAKKSRFL